MTDAVVLSRSERVLTVTLNRADRLNALTPAMMTELADAWRVAADPKVRAVVLTGAGRGFCAGVDRSVISGAGGGGAHRLRGQYHAVVGTLAALDKPVVAAVNGPAAGAGLALAAAADIRICVDHATFAGGFLEVGLAPDHGASFYLVGLLGYARSLELLGLGPWSSREATSRGLVAEIVPDAQLVQRAQTLADRLARHPALAMAATKRLLRQAEHSGLMAQLESEAAAYDLTSSDHECMYQRRRFMRTV